MNNMSSVFMNTVTNRRNDAFRLLRFDNNPNIRINVAHQVSVKVYFIERIIVPLYLAVCLERR